MNKYAQLNKNLLNHYGENVILRLFDRSDLFFLYNATQVDENFNKFLLWNKPDNFNDFVEKMDILLSTQFIDNLIYSIIDIKTGSWCGLLKLREYRNGLEMSLWIHPNFQKKQTIFIDTNYILLDTYFLLGYDNMYARCHVNNIPVQKMIKHYKFEEDGFDNTSIHENGTVYNAVVLNLAKYNWFNITKNKYETLVNINQF